MGIGGFEQREITLWEEQKRGKITDRESGLCWSERIGAHLLVFSEYFMNLTFSFSGWEMRMKVRGWRGVWVCNNYSRTCAGAGEFWVS